MAKEKPSSSYRDMGGKSKKKLLEIKTFHRNMVMLFLMIQLANTLAYNTGWFVFQGDTADIIWSTTAAITAIMGLLFMGGLDQE